MNEFNLFIYHPIELLSTPEGEMPEIKKSYYDKFKVFSINKKLTEMSEDDALNMNGKHIRILFKSNVCNGILAESGIMEYKNKTLNIENGWSNIKLEDIIDWYII